MNTDEHLRSHVLYLLKGGGAHMGLQAVLEGIPPDLRGARPDGVPYTPWRLLEHMRIAQEDILEYARDPAEWESPSWPNGYWPDGAAPPDDRAWDEAVEKLMADNRQLQKLVSDPKTDLLEPLPETPGHTVLRQALLAADHNAYHSGQLFTVRRLLGLVESDGQAPDNL